MSIRERVKRAIPPRVTERVRESLVGYGERTSDRRPLPDFLIIGTKRGGTTSLWRYLIEHPGVLPTVPRAEKIKGIYYFDENFHRGDQWYRSHFPTRARRLPARTSWTGRCGWAMPRRAPGTRTASV